MACKSSSILIRIQFLVLVIFFIHCQYVVTAKRHRNSTKPKYPIPGPKIAGGTPTFDGEFPFMAALGWINEAGELKFHGGGMVIHPRIVLTAAHCVYKDGKLPDYVYIGGKLLSEAGYQTETFTTHAISDVLIYPEYTSNQGYHDIALLELDEPTTFPPVCLWESENLNTNDVTAIGYGLTAFAGSGSLQLLKVNLTVFSLDECRPYFKRQRKLRLGLSEDQICAGDKEGIKDTCQGDSGGPLLVRDNNQFYAVGITSSGQACAGFPPAIYTKIQPYIGWIADAFAQKGDVIPQCNNFVPGPHVFNIDDLQF